MANVTTPTMTATEFAAWVDRPENRGRWWELDRGRIIEMPPPRPPHGAVRAMIVYLLTAFAIRRGRGRVESNDTGFLVTQDPDTVRGMDAAFYDESIPLAAVSREYSARPPALVVEVWSPSDRPNRMSLRVAEYLAAGVGMVWLVDPEEQTVAAYRAGQSVAFFAGTDTLAGADVLPDFSCKVSDLFTLPGAQPPAPPETTA